MRLSAKLRLITFFLSFYASLSVPTALDLPGILRKIEDPGIAGNLKTL